MELGTYLENGVYLPAISETPWGEQVNNNFIILSNQYDNIVIRFQEGLNSKLDKNSDEEQIINSNVKVKGEWEFEKLIIGTVSNSNYSSHALLADNASHSETADNATHANESSTSAYAISADSASRAETADIADTATSADFALKAKCDNNGSVIDETYLKISDYVADPSVMALNAVTDHIGNTDIHTSLVEKQSINNSLNSLSDNLNIANHNITNNTSDIRNLQLALEGLTFDSQLYVSANNDQTVNGSKTFTELINGNITGNATSADRFSSDKSITLTGDVTGSAVSKDTWNISTTLKNTGVISGSYGIQNNNTVYSGIIKVPYITVNSKGLITNISETSVALPDAGETDVLVEQKYVTYNLNYPLLFSEVADISSTSSRGAQKAGVSNSLFVNPSTNTIYATTFVGDLTGNADSASSSNKATNNANDNELSNTIIKGLTISGSTITYTQIDGNTGTITTPNTKVTQSLSENDDTYPVLLCPTADATANQGAKTSIFASDVKVNPFTGNITANGISVNSIDAVEFYQNGQLITDFGGNGNGISANDATLTIQKNSTTISTFTANASEDVTCDITVPTKVSDLENDSGFVTSEDLSNYATASHTHEYLPLTGGTLSGNITYTTTATRGTSPSSTASRYYADYKDSNGNRIALIDTEYKTDCSSSTNIYAYKTTVASGNSIGKITIGCDSSGKVYTSAPTPDTNDNSTKIATTAFVKANSGIVSNRVITAITESRTTTGVWAFTCTKHAPLYVIGSVTADYVPGSYIVVVSTAGFYSDISFTHNEANEAENGVVSKILISGLPSANSVSIEIKAYGGSTITSVSLKAYQ